MPAPPTLDAGLLSARFLPPNARELVFARIDGRQMSFEPGQWVNTILPMAPDNARAKRSYSIASNPDGSPRFEIAVTHVIGGAASTWLHSIVPGVVVPFTGPQGFFTRPLSGASPALMIATGTGVTPLRSMIRAAVGAGSRAPLWLLLGVRHEEDLLYEEELRALAQTHQFVRFEPTLSQPREDSWGARRDHAQRHVRS